MPKTRNIYVNPAQNGDLSMNGKPKYYVIS